MGGFFAECVWPQNVSVVVVCFFCVRVLMYHMYPLVNNVILASRTSEPK